MENSRRNFLRQTALGAAIATVGTTALAGLPAVASHQFDPQAILARVELAMDVLRDCYICEGWNENFDHTAADRTLSYFRSVAEHGEPDEDDEAMHAEWTSALNFFHSHGVSLDWVMRGDVASLISNGAAHSMRAEALQAA